MWARKYLVTYFILIATIIVLASGRPLAEVSAANPEVYVTWDLVEMENLGLRIDQL